MRSACIRIVIAVLLVGCDSVSDLPVPILECVSTPVDGTLQPLVVGNTWEYEWVEFSGSVSSTYRYQVTEKIHRSVPNGSDAFIISGYPTLHPERVRKDVWLNSPAGFSWIGTVKDEVNEFESIITYPYPTSTGGIFHGSRRAADPLSSEQLITPFRDHEVVSTNNRVELPIAVFETVVYKEPQFIVGGDAYGGPVYRQFAPGIGLVSLDVRHMASIGGLSPSRQMRLTNYCLMQ